MGSDTKSQTKNYKPQRVGRVTTNGYLNFLRCFKKKHCGLSPKEMIRKGAKAWNALTCEQKKTYQKMGPKGKKSRAGKKRCRKPARKRKCKSKSR